MMQSPILVCALADAPLVVPGTTFNHFCNCCGRRVMVAPTGQKLLKEMKGVFVICAKCYLRYKKSGDTTELAGSYEDTRQEVASAQPNLRRHRN